MNPTEFNSNYREDMPNGGKLVPSHMYNYSANPITISALEYQPQKKVKSESSELSVYPANTLPPLRSERKFLPPDFQPGPYGKCSNYYKSRILYFTFVTP